MSDSTDRKDQTMKISHVFAATGLAVASLTISTSADAQRWGGHGGGGWHDHGGRGDYGRGGGRGWDRGWHGYRGGWDGPRYRPYRPYRWRGGYGWYGGWYGPQCWIEWRYGYRVRICR